MKNPKDFGNLTFSILIANYNNCQYITEAIKSVLNQTYTSWELIIVDDCSTDNSIEVIKNFLVDLRIKLIQHNENKGYGATLKTAAINARMDIIAILDADDKLHEKALEYMAETYIKNPDSGFIYSTMWECDKYLENCVKNKWIGLTNNLKTNIFQIKISHLKTFRREAYLKTSGFDPLQKQAVDKDIVFKLEEVTDFAFINKPLYYYRWHGKGISQTKNNFIHELYNYRAKVKAYRRRLNSIIPNFTKKQIYFEYYRIVFFNLIHFLIKFYRYLRIKILVEKFLKNDNTATKLIRKKLRKFRELS